MGQGTACRSAFKISGGPLVPPILRLFPVAPVAYHACRRDNDQGRRSFQARRTSAFKAYFKGFTILDFKGASSASLPSSAYFLSRLWPAMHAGATATKGDQSRPPYEGPNVQDFVQGPNVQGFEVASHPPPALPSFQTLTAFCLACGLPCMQARQRPSKGDRSKAAVREYSRALRFDCYRGKARGFKLVWGRGEDVVTVRGGGSSSSGGTLSLYPSISVSRSRSRSSSYSALASAAATQPQPQFT